MACLKVINVKVNAYPGTDKCILGIQWSNQGVGSLTDAVAISVLIDGQFYTDGNAGYKFLSTSTGSIACESPRIAGGIVAGQTKTVVVRVYCAPLNYVNNVYSVDETHYVDSDAVSYKVPDGFVCSAPITSKPPHGKKN